MFRARLAARAAALAGAVALLLAGPLAAATSPAPISDQVTAMEGAFAPVSRYRPQRPTGRADS